MSGFGSRLRAVIAIAICFVGVAGCVNARASSDSSVSPVQTGGLVVRNNNWSAMTVYVAGGVGFRRLGEVEGLSERFFSPNKLGTLTSDMHAILVARPLAGTPFRSEPLAFAPGRTLVWTIQNQPALSYLTVR